MRVNTPRVPLRTVLQSGPKLGGLPSTSVYNEALLAASLRALLPPLFASNQQLFKHQDTISSLLLPLSLSLSLTSSNSEPGRAEADFGRLDTKTVVRNVYILFSRSELPIAAENQEIMDLVDSSTPLPSYKKSGFRTALRVPYRVIKEDLGITTDPTIKVPVLNIMGNKDYMFKFPGMADYINSGKLKELSPVGRLYLSLKELILFKNNFLTRLMSSSSPSLESTSDW